MIDRKRLLGYVEIIQFILGVTDKYGFAPPRGNLTTKINELSSPIRSFLCPIPILACKQYIF